MTRLVMSTFQRKAHKILVKEGWEIRRFTGSGHVLYERKIKGVTQTTTVSGSPSNHDQALKSVTREARKIPS